MTSDVGRGTSWLMSLDPLSGIWPIGRHWACEGGATLASGIKRSHARAKVHVKVSMLFAALAAWLGAL